ncbi:MAG: TM0106 family RecB-like putative nuclease [Magnetococcales bacterium]|nr:TM0106 family RecB-like putative nuclease [Magnetococcales bacterium]
MRRHAATILYAASDLNGFLGCRHSTFLDLRDLVERLPRAEDDAQARLVQDRGHEHEAEYLHSLKKSGLSVVEVPEDGDLENRVAVTAEVMRSGPDVIYQATLKNGIWHGFADFLRRVERPSRLGPFSYEAADTKLTKHPKPKHVIQLCLYSELLHHLQGVRPRGMSLVLGDRSDLRLRFDDFAYYHGIVRRRFEEYVSAPPETSRPEPCQFCELCKWRNLCADQWEREDHLSQVANIRRSQILKLESAGIATVQALARMDDDATVPSLAQETLARLRAQARLQVGKRETGENRVETLPSVAGRGFARMPRPAEGDLFFDMEGDPLYPDGLEYLFGFYFVSEGKPVFNAFWAHDHEEEKRTFQAVMDFVVVHLREHPGAHVYHYNHYEETALKRLASRYGTREDEVDDLLRGRKLVDLYKVVREAIRVSEPSYSIKNLETFYMEKRSAEVATAGDSIVVYETWRKTRASNLLQQISDYNEDDCRSTLLLRDWLAGLRPDDLPWFDLTAEVSSEEKLVAQQEAEETRQRYEQSLTGGEKRPDHEFRELVAQLLEFHRREAKPQWWAMFDRQDRADEDLVDDAECLGSLRADRNQPPYKDKRSTVFTYRFPPQETKLRVGSSCLQAYNLERAGEILELDMQSRQVRIKKGAKGGPLPEALSLTPTGPIDNKVLRNAVYRFADAIIAEDGRFQALAAFLRREMPSIAGHVAGSPIVPEDANLLTATIRAVLGLQKSYLFIQGPPGAGKTYTSSHVIVDLLRRGKKIGISSNSHKAINNLLSGIEKAASQEGVTFRGQKKSTATNADSLFQGEMIQNVYDSGGINLESDLIAGTAWLFARDEFDEVLDYLFIDEAGQVSLANLVAMGLSARNIVLVGDQMQLGQPIQGVHPGLSGMSILDYLLEGESTIPADQGIFLATTWRMHENVCRFISDAVYDGRLHPEPGTRNQALILSESAHPALQANGIRFIEARHEGCSQKSELEGEIVRDLIGSLTTQRYRDRDGQEHPLGLDNILVVTPYNVQVNHLREVLPEGAQVGTVDKFQGQEAEVVIISMVTSGAEDLPRNIEFLYSKNRLNVAISRARTLALIVANPNLLEIPCQMVEQMRLVNTLCWAQKFSMDQLEEVKCA